MRGRETCGPKQEEFIKHCFYTAGQYDDAASFTALSAELTKHEAGRAANRIFYLSIPPTVFVTVAQNAARCASSETGAPGWLPSASGCASAHPAHAHTARQATRASSWRSPSAATWSPAASWGAASRRR